MLALVSITAVCRKPDGIYGVVIINSTRRFVAAGRSADCAEGNEAPRLFFKSVRPADVDNPNLIGG